MPTIRLSPVPAAALFLGAAIACAVSGCSTPNGPSHSPIGIRHQGRIDVVPGAPAVLALETPEGAPGSRTLPIRFDDGRTIECGIFWLGTRDEVGQTPSSWLAAAPTWVSVSAPADSLPQSRGTWVAILDSPVDALGQGLWLDRRRYELNWALEALAAPADEPLWSRPAPRNIISLPRTAALIAPTRDDPGRWWRWVWLTQGLTPGTERETAPFQEPAISALAESRLALWRAGMTRLGGADPGLALRVRNRVLAMVDFGTGLVAPAWPGDQQAAELLDHLLDASVPLGEQTARVEAWLERQTRAVAWVIDEGGLTDAVSGDRLVTLGLASLHDVRSLAWGSAPSGSAPPEPVPVEPSSARDLLTRVPASLPGPSTIAVHLGSWQQTCSVIPEPVGVRPPGLSISPLAGDWTKDAWLAGDVSLGAAPPANASTAALLYRTRGDREGGAVGGAVAGGRPIWMLYVECAIDPDADRTGLDALRIWLGPFGRPISVLRVTRDGQVFDEVRGVSGRRGDFVRTSVTNRADRWIVEIPIPDACIDGDGTLRLGLERFDAEGARSAWPRRMLPWQVEPARAAIRTTTWGGLLPGD